MSISKNFLFSRRGHLPGVSFAHAATPVNGGNLVALAARFFGKFTRRPAPGGALEHLTTLPLTAQSALVLVRYGDETLLLGATAQNVNLLLRNRHDGVGDALADESSIAEEALLK
jgi:flagellar biosynthesis protein FliO